MVKFGEGRTDISNIRKGTFRAGVSRETIEKQEDQRIAKAQFEQTVAEQKQQIPSEIAERQERIKQLEQEIFEGTRRVMKLGDFQLDKEDVAKRRREIAKLKGEITYLKEAQSVLQQGRAIQGDLDSQASRYAKTTSDYATARAKLSRAKAKKRLSTEETKRIAEEYGISFKEASQLKKEGLRQETVTFTELPPETKTGIEFQKRLGGIILTPEEARSRGIETNTAVQISGESALTKAQVLKRAFLYGEIGEQKFIGGVSISRKDFSELSLSKQRSIQSFQPTNILLLTQFPKIVPKTEVLFGGRQVTKEGKIYTDVVFKTSRGQGGRAIGETKTLATRGNIYSGETKVIGLKGDRIVNLVKGGKLEVVRTQKFGGIEQSLGLRKGDRFVQISAGKLAEAKKVTSFRAVDTGVLLPKGVASQGITQIRGGLVYSSGGLLTQASRTARGVKVVNVGVGGTSLTKTFTQQSVQQALAKASTEAVVRSVVQSSPTVISEGVKLGQVGFASQELIQQQRQTPVQVQSPVPRLAQPTATKVIQLTPQATAQTPSLKVSTATITSQAQVPAIRTISPQITEAVSIGTSFKVIPTTPSTRRIPFAFKLPPIKSPSKFAQAYSVQVKSRGKFRTIASGLTKSQAVTVGSSRVGRTLSATFRLVPAGKTIKTSSSFGLPRTIKQKRKKTLEFVELPSARLDTPSEIKAIQLARIKTK